MNELQIFRNESFGEVRTLEINGEPWFVAADVCRALDINDVGRAVSRLDDDESTRIEIDHPQSRDKRIEVYIVNEPGLYGLVLGSRKPEAKTFKRWIKHDVLPSIRKTGGYNLPKDYPSALRALADAEEKRLVLEAENEIQRQQIADFQPIRQYVDEILSSPGTVVMTQIAADYGMSARALNKILHEEGIQRSVNGQWILYKEHMGKGYTSSKTVQITRSDGSLDTKINTVWTQKGRLMIHEILKSRGIDAVMDRKTIA